MVFDAEKFMVKRTYRYGVKYTKCPAVNAGSENFENMFGLYLSIKVV